MKSSERYRDIILGAAARQGMGTVKALAKKANIPYSTLNRHMHSPGDLTLTEIQRIATVTKMSEADIVELAKG